MARKSRKETAAVVVQEADATCRAAIYVRLSVEDTHTHSVSIETQQMIIARYLEQYPEISVYDTYIDAAVIIGLKTLRLKKCWKFGAF